MDLGLKGRVALVAAASKGLGKAAAWELAREGCRVAICARGDGELRAAANEIAGATNAEVFPVVCDVTQADEIAHLVRAVLGRWRRVDIMVNNAGGPPTGPFEGIDDAAWQAALELNLLSAMRLCRAVLPGMRERQWGRIVNITSVMVKQPGAGFALSTAARAGLVGLAKTLAGDYAPHGITINNVCPGYTLTDRVRDLVRTRAEREGKAEADILAEFKAQVPAGRLGQPEELAALVAFLASERAGYITGTTIQVDGGYIKGLL